MKAIPAFGRLMRYSLAKLLGIVTLTGLAFAAAAQFGSGMGFVSLLAVYGAVVMAALRGIEKRTR